MALLRREPPPTRRSFNPTAQTPQHFELLLDRRLVSATHLDAWIDVGGAGAPRVEARRASRFLSDGGVSDHLWCQPHGVPKACGDRALDRARCHPRPPLGRPEARASRARAGWRT